MATFWDERYRSQEYVYGENPNVFFAGQLSRLQPGTIILPCEGEGRNAAFAAAAGWKVEAFDTSESGRIKALHLAAKKGVTINYVVADAAEIIYPDNNADAVALIYTHFSPATRQLVYRKAVEWLKPGGTILVEVFNPKQMNNSSGGPKDPSMLVTEDMLKKDFGVLNIELLRSLQTVLHEGKFHQGTADIVQLIATKA